MSHFLGIKEWLINGNNFLRPIHCTAKWQKAGVRAIDSAGRSKRTVTVVWGSA